MGVLDGRRVVITGGSMGIGLAVAQHCAGAGASVALVSRHEEDLKRVVLGLGAGPGQSHRYHATDVSSIDQVRELAGWLERTLGCLDAVVCCAGVYGPIGRIDEVDPAEFVKALQINLVGTFNICHCLIPLLRKANKGKIINYSGGGAAGPFPNYAAYAVSKAGVVRLTENMALELKAEGIDVNAIAPGFVVTRLHRETIQAGAARAGADFLRKTQEQMETGGVSPDVAARLTVFLLSARGDGITGKFISAPWDPWEADDFLRKLKVDGDFATLRRIDDKSFFKRPK